jgi:hypothetical protein
MAFQVTSPFNRYKTLLPHALVMHVNPTSINEAYNQKIERFQTRGGYQEQHWGQDLTEVSADASTGAFMNIYSGLSSIVRQRTIAWDRYRDLHDLYQNNGSVYDPFGSIVLQGNIMLMYDRGTYLGTFRTFEVEETEDSPFAFKMSWSFKIEQTILAVPFTPLDGIPWPAPRFQRENLPTKSAEDGQKGEEAARQEEEAARQEEWRRQQIAVVEQNIAKAEQHAEYEEARKKFDEEGPGSIFQKLPEEPTTDGSVTIPKKPGGRR